MSQILRFAQNDNASATVSFKLPSRLTLAILAVVALAGALRLAWIIYAKTEPVWFFDPWSYDRLATALADGHGYVNEAGQPTAYYPPGYPAVLGAVYWLVGHRPAAGEVLNVLLGAVTAGLVYWIGSRAFGRTAGLLAAVAFAVFPSHILYASQLHSEVVFTAAYLLALGLLLAAPAPQDKRWLRFWLAAGLAIGMAGLIRPAALSLLVVVPIVMRPGGTPWKTVARGTGLAVLAAALVMTPWVARNAVKVGVPAVSTNAGIDFWIGNHDGASGLFVMPTPDVFPIISDDLQEQERHDYHRGIELGWRFIREQPLDALALLPLKAYHLYTDDAHAVTTTETWGHTVFLSEGGRRVLRSLTDSFYYFVLAGAVAGLILPLGATRGPRPKGRPSGRWPLATALAGWTLVYLVYFGEPRFHLPVTPVMAVLAAPFWIWTAGLLQRPILSKWHALRSPAASKVDGAEAL
jgi:4-amino-4-deoxy-L-arabinose transferase-like glycosyltransferase